MVDPLTPQQREQLIEHAFELVAAVNDNLKLANETKAISFRESHWEVANMALNRLTVLASMYPFLKIQNLEAVDASVRAVADETKMMIAENVRRARESGRYGR